MNNNNGNAMAARKISQVEEQLDCLSKGIGGLVDMIMDLQGMLGERGYLTSGTPEDEDPSKPESLIVPVAHQIRLSVTQVALMRGYVLDILQRFEG